MILLHTTMNPPKIHIEVTPVSSTLQTEVEVAVARLVASGGGSAQGRPTHFLVRRDSVAHRQALDGSDGSGAIRYPVGEYQGSDGSEFVLLTN